MKPEDQFINSVLANGNLGKHTVQKLKKSLIRDVDIYCCFCNKKFKKAHEITIEHIVPKSKLIADKNKIDNLALSCDKCNNDRETADFESYRTYKRTEENPPFGSKVERRTRQLKKALSHKNEILSSFNDGVTVHEIASKFAIKQVCVKKILEENDL